MGNTRFFVIVWAALLLVAACSKDGTGPAVTRSDTVSVSITSPSSDGTINETLPPETPVSFQATAGSSLKGDISPTIRWKDENGQEVGQGSAYTLTPPRPTATVPYKRLACVRSSTSSQEVCATRNVSLDPDFLRGSLNLCKTSFFFGDQLDQSCVQGSYQVSRSYSVSVSDSYDGQAATWFNGKLALGSVGSHKFVRHWDNAARNLHDSASATLTVTQHTITGQAFGACPATGCDFSGLWYVVWSGLKADSTSVDRHTGAFTLNTTAASADSSVIRGNSANWYSRTIHKIPGTTPWSQPQTFGLWAKQFSGQPVYADLATTVAPGGDDIFWGIYQRFGLGNYYTHWDSSSLPIPVAGDHSTGYTAADSVNLQTVIDLVNAKLRPVLGVDVLKAANLANLPTKRGIVVSYHSCGGSDAGGCVGISTDTLGHIFYATIYVDAANGGSFASKQFLTHELPHSLGFGHETHCSPSWPTIMTYFRQGCQQASDITLQDVTHIGVFYKTLWAQDRNRVLYPVDLDWVHP